MFCKYCGVKLPDGSQFCSNCGKKLTSSILSPPDEKPTAEPIMTRQTNESPTLSTPEISAQQQDKSASAPSITKSEKTISLVKSASIEPTRPMQPPPLMTEPSRSANTPTQKKPAPSKSSTGKVIAIVATVVLVIGCAVGVAFSSVKNKQAQANAQAQAQAKAAQVQENISYTQRVINEASDTFYAYIYRFTDAINANDFSLVSPILLNGSDIYNEQKKMVPYFANQSITEDVVSVSIKDIWLEQNNTIAAVVSDEVIGVTYSDRTYKEIAQSYTYYIQIQSESGEIWCQMYKMVEA